MRTLKNISSLVVLLLSAQANANDLTVLSAGGSSASRYYESLSIQSSEKAIPPLPNIQVHDINNMMFPVKSNLTPGYVQARTINANGLAQPIFLMGYDETSIEWLQQRRTILVELNAIGLVVNVPDAEAMAYLQSLVPELMMSPVPGDDIAERIGTKHYPFLLTRNSIEQ